jgi:general stress protein CsbA
MFASIGSAAGSALPVFQDEPACAQYCPKLTFQQRIIGFGACFGIGWLMSFMGTLTLIGGPSTTNIRTFIILYIFGNVIALCATGFLLGPRTQCQKMFHPTRRYSTIFYLVMLIIVFAVAVAKQHIALVLVLLFIEVLAALWYSISYIPFARKIVIGILRRSPCGPLFDAVDQAKGSIANATSSGNNSTNNSGFMSKRGFTLLNDDQY